MPVTLTFPPIGLRLTYPYSVGEMADAADSIDEEALLICEASAGWFLLLVSDREDGFQIPNANDAKIPQATCQGFCLHGRL